MKNKPTGKLEFAYQTIAKMEAKIEDQAARIAELESLSIVAVEAERTERWIKVETSLPKTEHDVIAFYLNSHGKGRRVRAWYTPANTTEAPDDHWDECAYDEEKDMMYLPEGWYEHNEQDEMCYHISETVTHWMPLPDPPSDSLAPQVNNDKTK